VPEPDADRSAVPGASLLLDGNLVAGAHAVDWNSGKAVRSGVYLLRCEFSGRDVVRRLVVTR